LRRLNFMLSLSLSLSLSLNLCCLLQLSEIVNQGKLVSDEIIISLLSKRLESGEAKGDSGFILDGFPRTINQAVSIFAVFKRDCYYVNSVSFSFYFFNLWKRMNGVFDWEGCHPCNIIESQSKIEENKRNCFAAYNKV